MIETALFESTCEAAEERPRFVVDKTLGRLARWLRIIGCDAEYGRHLGGPALLRRARKSKRVILTRDRRLVRGADVPPHRLIESDRFRDQLREVVEAFSIDPYRRLFERCVECNGDLETMPREEAKGQVPEYVFRTQDVFHRCRRCHHVFWEATHVDRVRAELERMGFRPPRSGSEGGAPR